MRTRAQANATATIDMFFFLLFCASQSEIKSQIPAQKLKLEVACWVPLVRMHVIWSLFCFLLLLCVSLSLFLYRSHLINASQITNAPYVSLPSPEMQHSTHWVCLCSLIWSMLQCKCLRTVHIYSVYWSWSSSSSLTKFFELIFKMKKLKCLSRFLLHISVPFSCRWPWVLFLDERQHRQRLNHTCLMYVVLVAFQAFRTCRWLFTIFCFSSLEAPFYKISTSIFSTWVYFFFIAFYVFHSFVSVMCLCVHGCNIHLPRYRLCVCCYCWLFLYTFFYYTFDVVFFSLFFGIFLSHRSALTAVCVRRLHFQIRWYVTFLSWLATDSVRTE